MVERIEDMPAGTVGFRSDGPLSDDDYNDILGPALRDAVEGGGVRLMLVTPAEFGSSDVTEVAKRVQGLPGLGHREDWKRVAVVTDSGWLRRTARLWSGMVPVDTKIFAPDDEPKARDWLQG